MDAQVLHSLADYEAAAHAALSERALAYIAGGAGDELTVADNSTAWSRLALAPRVFTDVAEIDLSVTVLGERRPHPVILAPTAFAALAHPDAEVGVARAAARTSTIQCLSTFASTAPAALAAAVPEVDRWFQLYVQRDRGLTRELIAAAESHGFRALVLTADRPVIGVRGRERRQAVRDATHPAADRADGADGPGTVPATALTAALPRTDAPIDTSDHVDPSVTWADVEAFAAQTSLPLIIKGILTATDTRRARDAGAAAVIVSNHGGRQLDTVLAGADALPEVVDAAAGELDVLVDGGVRRGTDVVKALALGARAVLIGRPVLHGLAVDGEPGVRAVIELLLAELRTTLALVGVPRAAALDGSVVRPAPWAR